MIRLVIEQDDIGRRLDRVLAQRLEHPRGEIARWFQESGVSVGGQVVKPSAKLDLGVEVLIEIPENPVLVEAEQAEIPLAAVRFEDSHLIVVSKPAGVVVHPAPGHHGLTLVDQLQRMPDPPRGGDPERPGIVHRLDKDTSGLLLVARTPEAYEVLSGMMARRAITRRYVAMLSARLEHDALTVDAPIGRDPRHRTKMTVIANGRDAVTHFEVIERIVSVTYVNATLETGRTHQIRVHASAIDAPVLGDKTYGGGGGLAASVGLERPFLHATHLRFVHPVTGDVVALDDPLPEDLERALADIRGQGPSPIDPRPPHRREGSESAEAT